MIQTKYVTQILATSFTSEAELTEYKNDLEVEFSEQVKRYGTPQESNDVLANGLCEMFYELGKEFVGSPTGILVLVDMPKHIAVKWDEPAFQKLSLDDQKKTEESFMDYYRSTFQVSVFFRELEDELGVLVQLGLGQHASLLAFRERLRNHNPHHVELDEDDNAAGFVFKPSRPQSADCYAANPTSLN